MDPEAPPSDGRPAASTGGAPGESLEVLFRDLAMGRVSALEGIYDAMSRELYGLTLWRTGSPADAEDAVQTVFVRLAGAGEWLAAVRNPRHYLLAMAHRACIDMRRGPFARTVPLPEEEASFLQAPSSEPGRALDARRISTALSELSVPQREVIFLHHFSELTFAAIGRVTGVPTFTAASRYRNGILALRRILGLTR